MHNQILRGLIFVILVFLVTSDLKELFTTIAASSTLNTFLQRTPTGAAHSSHSHHHQRSRRHAAGTATNNNPEDDGTISSLKFKPFTSRDGQGEGDNVEDSSSGNNDYDSLSPSKRLSNRGQNLYAKKKVIKLNDEEKKELLAMKSQLTAVMQEWCLPKLVCELHASVADRGSLTEAEKGLLSLIRETSLGTMGEVVSRYHFAAHMGQLIAGVEGNGCHNFYPNCPLSGTRVLQMMKKVRIR